jgi:hypothetical protein
MVERLREHPAVRKHDSISREWSMSSDAAVGLERLQVLAGLKKRLITAMAERRRIAESKIALAIQLDLINVPRSRWRRRNSPRFAPSPRHASMLC